MIKFVCCSICLCLIFTANKALCESVDSLTLLLPEEALQYHYQMLHVHESASDRRESAAIHDKIGSLLVTQGEDSLAMEHFIRSLKHRQAIEDHIGITFSFNYIGDIHIRWNNIDQAYDFFSRALLIAVETGDLPSKALTFSNLGRIFLYRNDLKQALKHFRTALDIQNDLGNKDRVSYNLNKLSEIYIQQGRHERALSLLENSLALGQELRSAQRLQETYKGLSEIYSGLGDFEQAFLYQHLFQQLRDSIFTIERARAIGGIKEEYQTDVKRKEVQINTLKRTNWIAGIIILALLLVGILLFIRNRLEIKTNHLLLKEKKQIALKNKELEKSNVELNEFNHAVSHDLKQPLRTIGSFATLLKLRYAKKLDQDGAEFIHFITSGVGHMHNLLTDLQTYTQAGKDEVEFELVEMNVIIREVVQGLKQSIQEQNATIDCAELPVIYAHRTSMHQLFQNLICNSMKFCEGRAPVIKIRHTGDEKYHCIQVEDNGIGISSIYHKKIFEAFKRLHSQEEYPGSGLGLAICQKLVKLHDGYIKLSSQPGVGSVFSIYLPTKNKVLLES